jgi:hypothetical protein
MPFTKRAVLALIAVSAVFKEVLSTNDVRDTAAMSCLPVETVPLCANLGYPNTTFPNMRGHTTPEEANEELAHFLALVDTGCSNAIVHLLCAIYAPMCIQKYLEQRLVFPPCKNLCEYVRDGCADTLLEEFGYSWPPGPHLDCHIYQSAVDNQLCFGPADPSILEMPSITKCMSLNCYAT